MITRCLLIYRGLTLGQHQMTWNVSAWKMRRWAEQELRSDDGQYSRGRLRLIPSLLYPHLT